MTGTPIGLADLVRALAALRPEDRETRANISSLLGFGLEDDAPRLGPSGEQPTDRRVEKDPNERSDIAPPPPTARRDRPFQLKRRLRDSADSTVPTEIDIPTAPPLLAATADEALPPPFTSLLTPQWSRALLSTLAWTWTASGDVDLSRVVATVARRQPLERLPRLAAPTVKRGLQILVDAGDSMTPFWRDQTALVEAARRVVGEEHVAVFRFNGFPLSLCLREGSPRPVVYAPPPAGTPVLLLTSLNICAASQDVATDDEWLDFVAVVRRAGCPITALVPYSHDRWPEPLRRVLPMVSWDRTSDVRSALRIAAARRRG